jgi:branched-chain amino acid transport system substrate-binding protein
VAPLAGARSLALDLDGITEFVARKPRQFLAGRNCRVHSTLFLAASRLDVLYSLLYNKHIHFRNLSDSGIPDPLPREIIMADRVGQQLGNYRLVRLLGLGGFAEVYLGEHIHLGTQAAIKVLYTRLAHADVEQFRTEARTIARLVHPHIVRVLEFGVDVEGTTPFLVMDYAPNGTLRQRYPTGSMLPLSIVINYVKQIADALQYAHDEKLIHRDIKPENMLLGRRGEVLLSDFGIALVAQSSRYQHTQDIAGTVAYMAPEQIQAHPRPASDQYSLGIVVYEWLSGDRPFHGSFTELAVKHSVVPPPSLYERVPALLPAVEQVVMIALAKDPRQRFASVQAFATALEQASKSSPDLAVQPSQSTPPHEASTLLNQVPPLPEVAAPPGELPQPPRTASSRGQPSIPPSQSPGAAPPVRETSLPAAQIPPPGQSVSGITPPNWSSYPLNAVPPAGQPLTGAITPLPAPPASSVTDHSISKIQPRQQHTTRVLFTLMILATVVVAGGGIAWLALLHNSGSTGSVSINGGITGSTMIKIGTDLPVSSVDRSFGKPVENAVHLAVNEANANHTIPGYTLVFDPRDDVGPSGFHDPAVGAQNVRALISDALVAGIVGPFNSNVAKAEMPITNQAPIALISPSNTAPCLTQEAAAVECSGANDLVPTLRPTGKVTYFRTASTDDQQGLAGADYLFNSLHYRNAYVIDDAGTYGVGIADAFSKQWTSLGATILGRSSEAAPVTSYVSLLTQIASKHPDVIYFSGLESKGVLIRQQMQQVPGLQNTPFAGTDSIVTPSFASSIGTSGGPVYGTIAVEDTTAIPSASSFRAKYMAAYGDTLTLYSAAAYDCANILIQAIKTALARGAHTPRDSSDATGARALRQAVISAVQGISYDGVTGHQSFDQNGDTTNKVLTIYQLANLNGKPDWKFITTVQVQ